MPLLKQTIMKKVRTRKELESKGIATIVSNDFWGFGDDNEYNYVLNIVKKGLIFKNERTSNYPHKTIKSCIDHYNEGFVEK
jgi:hypothetical protein